MSIPAIYLDGRSVLRRAASVNVSAQSPYLSFRVEGEEGVRQLMMDQVNFEAGLPGVPDMLLLPDGGVLEIEQQYRAQHHINSSSSIERVLQRLHGAWHLIVGLLVAAGVMIWAGYFYGLPWLAEVAAHSVPVRAEELLTEEALEFIKKTRHIRDSELPQARQEEIQALLQRVTSSAPASAYRYQLRIVNAPVIGANAFALPGGQLLITDALIKKAHHDDEILAVLAHEVGHVEHRHGLRNLIQSGGIFLIVVLITGDPSPVLAMAPAVLVQMKYSRDFEREADQYAHAQLKALHVSPCVLGQFLARLTQDVEHTEARDLLSSHPGSEERLEAAGVQCMGTQEVGDTANN